MPQTGVRGKPQVRPDGQSALDMHDPLPPASTDTPSPLVADPEALPLVADPEALPLVTDPDEPPLVAEPDAFPLVVEPDAFPLVVEPELLPLLTEPDAPLPLLKAPEPLLVWDPDPPSFPTVRVAPEHPTTPPWAASTPTRKRSLFAMMDYPPGA